QLHDAAKSGIRTAFAAMVASNATRPYVLAVKRHANTSDVADPAPSYRDDACLDMWSADDPIWTPTRTVPPQTKPCQAFEEYIASVAAKTVIGGAGLFTAADVNKIH